MFTLSLAWVDKVSCCETTSTQGEEFFRVQPERAVRPCRRWNRDWSCLEENSFERKTKYFVSLSAFSSHRAAWFRYVFFLKISAIFFSLLTSLSRLFLSSSSSHIFLHFRGRENINIIQTQVGSQRACNGAKKVENNALGGWSGGDVRRCRSRALDFLSANIECLKRLMYQLRGFQDHEFVRETRQGR